MSPRPSTPARSSRNIRSTGATAVPPPSRRRRGISIMSTRRLEMRRFPWTLPPATACSPPSTPCRQRPTATQPAISLTGASGVFQGQVYDLTINQPSDLGGRPQQYIIHWGDGNSSSYTNIGTVDHIFAVHVYSVPQHAIVTADLVDDTGAFL